MFGQITILRKTFTTNVAGKWLFSSVGAEMVKQVPSLLELLAASIVGASETSLLSTEYKMLISLTCWFS
jgi:hypothetical protein